MAAVLAAMLNIGPGFCLDIPKLNTQADSLSLVQAAELTRQEPDSLERLYVLGVAYLNEEQNASAQETFNRMLQIDPDSLEGQWGRAEMLRRKHQNEESRRILQEIIAKQDAMYPAKLTLAYLEYLRCDFSAGVDLAQAVVHLGPERVDRSNYVRALCLLGGIKGMLAHYGGPMAKVFNGRSILPLLRKAERLQPDNPAVSFGLGSYFLLIPPIFGRDIVKAERYLRKAIELAPWFAEAYVRLAQVRRVAKDEQQFAGYLKQSLEIDPQSEIALDIKNGSCKFICVKEQE
jgi:cytochrome c-type biogenesis protein CcmH/NrfG